MGVVYRIMFSVYALYGCISALVGRVKWARSVLAVFVLLSAMTVEVLNVWIGQSKAGRRSKEKYANGEVSMCTKTDEFVFKIFIWQPLNIDEGAAILRVTTGNCELLIKSEQQLTKRTVFDEAGNNGSGFGKQAENSDYCWEIRILYRYGPPSNLIS